MVYSCYGLIITWNLHVLMKVGLMLLANLYHEYRHLQHWDMYIHGLFSLARYNDYITI